MAVAMLSRRSPFVLHLRVGKKGAPLWVWKLRTMWTAQEPLPSECGWTQTIVAEPVSDQKNQFDERITSRLALFCRRHSIDELPQLWNVLTGEMSLVGPRPLTRSELVRHYGKSQHLVLSVKPGLTGLWQTGGRSKLDWQRRVELDMEISSNLTLTRYISILLRTIPSVLHGNGAW